MTRIAKFRRTGFTRSSRFGVHRIPLQHSSRRQIRLSESELHDVEKWVTIIDRNDNTGPNWGPRAGHDVGMAPVDVDEDSAETLKSFDVDLKELNEKAGELAAQIARSYEKLGA